MTNTISQMCQHTTVTCGVYYISIRCYNHSCKISDRMTLPQGVTKKRMLHLTIELTV